MKRDVVIIGSCGANLASLGFALKRLGVEAPVTTDPERVREATHVILPGVGAAGAAMSRLAADGLADVVPTLEQPVLGICLGMQLLFAGSDEDDAKCLGVIDAQAGRLPQSADAAGAADGLEPRRAGRGRRRCSRASTPGAYAYFIHSYAVPPGPYTRAVTQYGVPFSAVIEQRNFYGTQFHPERSSAMGARILDNFLEDLVSRYLIEMELIPAIDLRDGRCVRLLKGDFAHETRYEVDPVELALQYRDAGAAWLHVVDLDGAKRGEPVNLALVERMRRASGLKVQLGGGIRKRASLDAALGAADRARDRQPRRQRPRDRRGLARRARRRPSHARPRRAARRATARARSRRTAGRRTRR